MMQYKFFNAAFSLVEIIIVIFVLLLISIAVWTFQSNVFSLNNIISGNITAQEEARSSFKMITAEIRSASPSSTGAYSLSEAGVNSFTFYSDIDDDGLKERIRYFLSSSILKKGIIKPSGNPLVYDPDNEETTEIIHNVYNDTTPIFDYYDANYDGTTDPLVQPVNISAIRLVKITVIVNSASLEAPIFTTFTTQVSMRNLKDNL